MGKRKRRSSDPIILNIRTLSRRYTQGDYVEMEALSWHNDAYTTTLLPLALEAGGDKGPLAAVLALKMIGRGEFRIAGR